MADRRRIEWTDATWNPTVGCSIVSPGCARCYAMKQAHRFSTTPGSKFHGLTEMSKGGPVWNGVVRLDEKALDQPLRWKRGRRIFVNSMSDLFHEALPDAAIDKVFAVMALAPQHTFQVLTKRAQRMRDYMAAGAVQRQRAWARAFAPGTFRLTLHEIELRLLPGLNPEQRSLYHAPEPIWPLPNVWLGVSVERQQEADERREDLRALAAAGWTTFVSFEPALGPVDWSGWEFVRQIISGGESGPDSRSGHRAWHRAARDFCGRHGIAYFFKQWGDWIDADELYDWLQGLSGGILRDGRPWKPRQPLTYDDAATVAGMVGGRHEHRSDGTTAIRLRRSLASRLLDGRGWNEFPANNSPPPAEGPPASSARGQD